MIPSSFDYEVAESAEHAVDAARLAGGREAARRRALADPAAPAPLRPAVAARRHRPASPSSRTCATRASGSRSGR